MPMLTGNGKIPNFTEREWFKTPKTDCALNVYQGKEFYHLDSRFVDLENSGLPATLSRATVESGE